MTVSYRPSPEALPDLARVVDKYDAVVQLAGEILQGPMSVRLRCWEDGEVEIRAYHGHGYPDCDVTHRTVIRYHSNEGKVIGAVFETSRESKTLLYREQLTTIGTLDE